MVGERVDRGEGATAVTDRMRSEIGHMACTHDFSPYSAGAYATTRMLGVLFFFFVFILLFFFSLPLSHRA